MEIYDVIELAAIFERDWEVLEDLKAAAINKLVVDHGFLFEDAEVAVEESIQEDPDMWNENASASDLANYLASYED